MAKVLTEKGHIFVRDLDKSGGVSRLYLVFEE